MLSQHHDSIHFQSHANAQITLDSRKSDPCSIQMSWVKKATVLSLKKGSLKRLQIDKNLVPVKKHEMCLEISF